MLVLAEDSSRKTSELLSQNRLHCSHSSRAALISSRPCSEARRVFFVGYTEFEQCSVDNRNVTNFVECNFYIFECYRGLFTDELHKFNFLFSAEHTGPTTSLLRLLWLPLGISSQPILNGFAMHTVGMSQLLLGECAGLVCSYSPYPGVFVCD